MGQRFGGAAALVRKSALEWGRSQIGSENYNYRAALGKWKNPSWKCNAFVIRAFNHNVIPETIGEKANPETWGLKRRAYLEVISKLLKIVKAPSLRSDKGSVFPPSHKATAGQAPVTLQVATSNYPLQLFANGIFVIF